MKVSRRKPSTILSKLLTSVSEEEKRHTRNRMLIAIRIADALELKNLTQKKFAEMMGKSESEISEWLSGNRNFTIDTLSDISECLGISLLSRNDMKTRRISGKRNHIRISRSRSPRPYVIKNKNIILNLTGEWNNSPYAGNQMIVLA